MEAPKESCPVKRQLFAEWQKATETYSKTVADLSKKIGVLPRAEYEKLAQSAEEARAQSLEAKAALDTHTKLHGCNGGEIAA
jgi:hypothetical protein